MFLCAFCFQFLKLKMGNRLRKHSSENINRRTRSLNGMQPRVQQSGVQTSFTLQLETAEEQVRLLSNCGITYHAQKLASATSDMQNSLLRINLNFGDNQLKKFNRDISLKIFTKKPKHCS